MARAGAGAKPVCAIFGVAPWILIGGGCRAKGLAWILADDLTSTYCAPAYPSSAWE